VILRVQVSPKEYPKFTKLIQVVTAVEECHHVTGGEAFVLKAAVADVGELEKLIEKLSAFGPTVTSVILSTPLERRVFSGPA
jgi:Lrp/AsnC family leucine-responsive transcriptional regulator